jgi:hypothetical protein
MLTRSRIPRHGSRFIATGDEYSRQAREGSSLWTGGSTGCEVFLEFMGT